MSVHIRAEHTRNIPNLPEMQNSLTEFRHSISVPNCCDLSNDKLDECQLESIINFN